MDARSAAAIRSSVRGRATSAASAPARRERRDEHVALESVERAGAEPLDDRGRDAGRVRGALRDQLGLAVDADTSALRPQKRSTSRRPPSRTRTLRFVRPPSSVTGLALARAERCRARAAPASPAIAGELTAARPPVRDARRDLDHEARAIAAVAVARELDGRPAGVVGDPLDEHQRRARRARRVPARRARVAWTGSRRSTARAGRAPVALAHQRVERAAEIEVVDAREELQREPRTPRSSAAPLRPSEAAARAATGAPARERQRLADRRRGAATRSRSSSSALGSSPAASICSLKPATR